MLLLLECKAVRDSLQPETISGNSQWILHPGRSLLFYCQNIVPDFSSWVCVPVVINTIKPTMLCLHIQCIFKAKSELNLFENQVLSFGLRGTNLSEVIG